MVVVDRFAIQDRPSRCAYCGQRFNHFYAWRSSSGKLYCSEFCADDEEEANFQNMHHHDEPARLLDAASVFGANVSVASPWSAAAVRKKAR